MQGREVFKEMRYSLCSLSLSFPLSLSVPLSQGHEPLPNPFADPELSMTLSNDLQHWLYMKAKWVWQLSCLLA